jgi:hypothetical protein
MLSPDSPLPTPDHEVKSYLAAPNLGKLATALGARHLGHGSQTCSKMAFLSTAQRQLLWHKADQFRTAAIPSAAGGFADGHGDGFRLPGFLTRCGRFAVCEFMT